MDWKAAIRKKIAHNNTEARATGGGPFNKHVLTSTEDLIARICGIYTVIEGIPDTLEFGDQLSTSTASTIPCWLRL